MGIDSLSLCPLFFIFRDLKFSHFCPRPCLLIFLNYDFMNKVLSELVCALVCARFGELVTFVLRFRAFYCWQLTFGFVVLGTG